MFAMLQTAHSRVVFRALQIAGGIERLAGHLRESPDDIRAWVKGREIPRADVFFRLVDILARAPRADEGKASTAET